MDRHSVDDVFRDFKGRRAGLIKALTDGIDFEIFFLMCDPEKENLCLFGYPNEQWEVNLPAEKVPPELPEPALGISFSRDGMLKKDWVSLVAIHSDTWLLSLAQYYGARFGFDKAERKRLFNMMNCLPTICEVVTASANNSNLNSNAVQQKNSLPSNDEDEDEDEDEDDETLCGTCAEVYASDEFWICCDTCNTWFHGMCVKITPARAKRIKHYKCPNCTNKRSQP